MARRGVYRSSVAPLTVKTPCVYLVRHGETAYNVGDERFRSHADVPLNENGEQRARELADEFRDVDVSKIFTSDLSRAAATAESIHEENGAPLVQTFDLRPWDVGELTGKPVKTHLATMKLYLAHPSETVPGGEAFDTFKQRFLRALKRYLALAIQTSDQGAIVLVTHTRNVRVALGWLATGTDNDTIDMDYLNSKQELNPSEYVTLEYEDDEWAVEDASDAQAPGTQAS